MRPTAIFIAALCAACAHSRSGDGEAADAATPAVAVETCTAPVPDGYGPWRQVRAEGFTFCVPTSWSPAAPRARGEVERRPFRFVGGRLSWSASERAQVVTVRAPAAGMMAPQQPLVQRTTELIGGQLADLIIAEWPEDVQLRTAARWTSASLYFAGTARDRAAADLELAVYRTVRFTSK